MEVQIVRVKPFSRGCSKGNSVRLGHPLKRPFKPWLVKLHTLIRVSLLKTLSEAFRDVKYQDAFNPSPVSSNRCNSKILVPHHGMRCAEEFPACSDHYEFLQCRLESSSTKALKS